MESSERFRRPEGYEACFEALLAARFDNPTRFGPFTVYFDAMKLEAVRDKYGKDLYDLCRSDAIRYLNYTANGENALELFENEGRLTELREIWNSLESEVKNAPDQATRVALIRKRTAAHNEFFELLNRYGYRSGGADMKENYIALVDEMLPKTAFRIVGRVNSDLTITLIHNYDPVGRRWVNE